MDIDGVVFTLKVVCVRLRFGKNQHHLSRSEVKTNRICLDLLLARLVVSMCCDWPNYTRRVVAGTHLHTGGIVTGYRRRDSSPVVLTLGE